MDKLEVEKVIVYAKHLITNLLIFSYPTFRSSVSEIKCESFECFERCKPVSFKATAWC